MTKFTKILAGRYEFTSRFGEHYEAVRNEAMFGGRAWELRELVDYGTPACRSVFVEDMLASRDECAQIAEQVVPIGARF